MDPADSAQGQEQPSDQSWLSPSSKGRKRRKNSKYLDYETDYELGVKGLPQGHPGTAGEKASPRASPARKPKNVSRQTASEEKAASDKTAQVFDEQPSEETPKKTARARKSLAKATPARKTPAQKTPAAAAATAAGGAVRGVQQENGTPKPPRRNARKQEATATSEPPCEEAQEQPPVVAEEEAEPGRRRRRGAAKAAMKYLHILAEEMLDHESDESRSQPGANSVTSSQRKTPNRSKVTKGRKRKRPDFDSDAPEDEDFVPGAEEVEEDEPDETEDEESAESSESEPSRGGSRAALLRGQKSNSFSTCKAKNGLPINAMKVVWEFTETTKQFRAEHYSSWVFADWVPSSGAWQRVPHSDVDKYLPEEHQSAAFRVSREGLSKEETPLHRLHRFGSVPFHAERWDMLLFAGGPVWAMEWCPTPDGVPATQYLALACHRGMDERHRVNRTYTGPGLVQLWDVGQLEYDTRPVSQPALAYAVAQDKGFIWQLKWCPAGGWEPPACGGKAPILPRLGLLAVATSDGVVTVYSLPHPDALHSNQLSGSENRTQPLPVYKAQGVVTLKLGALNAPRLERSGQVLSMDWLPEKPHNILAVGFYDGTVGLWDLSTKSSLLRIREADDSLTLLPYRCLLAHDHAVRALAFCPASRHLLVTAGEDRYVKTWDLRRPYDPITVQKRYLTNEIYWPLNGAGLLVAQDCAYTPRGSQGVHYLEHHFNPYFAIPRIGTVWSLSYTDWMNSVVTSDSFGEVIFAVLPQIACASPYVKRTLERRFPVYFTSVLPYDTPEAGAAEENAAEAQEGRVTEDSDTQNDEGNKTVNGNEREEQGPSPQFETYKEATKGSCLHQTDFDMRSFVGMEKRALWQRMKNTEVKRKLNPDEMHVGALYKVRFNPNMNSHVWVASGGQTGLVRLNCLRAMISSESKKIVGASQRQVSAPYPADDQDAATQTLTDQL